MIHWRPGFAVTAMAPLMSLVSTRNKHCSNIEETVGNLGFTA